MGSMDLGLINLLGHKKSVAMEDKNIDPMVQSLRNFFIELI